MKCGKARLGLVTSILIIGGTAVVLNSCGHEGDGSSSRGGTSTTPIADAAEGSAAAGSAQAAASVGTGISDLADSLGHLGGSSLGLDLPSKPINPLTAPDSSLAKMATKARKAAASKVISIAATRLKAAATGFKSALTAVSPGGACGDGGSWTASGTADISGTFDVVVTLAGCREDGDQMDGEMHITGNASSTGVNVNAALGDDSSLPTTDLVILTFNDATYSSLVGRFKTAMDLQDTSLCGVGSFTDGACTAGSYSLAASGTASYDDYTLTPVQTINLSLSRFTDSGSFSMNTGSTAETDTYDDTLGGRIDESWTDPTDRSPHGVTVGFSNFNVHVEDDIAPSAPLVSRSSVNSFDRFTSFSGTVSIDFTPDSDCPFEGTFSLVTDSPLHRTSPDRCPIGGHLTINGRTTLTYNSDGSVDVATGADTMHYDSCREMDAVCPFEDFQASGGRLSGSYGTPVSGNGFLVALSWNDFDLNGSPGPTDASGSQTSDMDLHVGYYSNPNPTAGPAEAEISWDTGDNLMVGYNSTRFGAATAVLDFDDSQGKGPEHITVTGLPAGYYVIAVDSFDLHLAASVAVNTSVTIGGSIYTFPPHTFTTADHDASEPSTSVPSAWYRVTDLQCLSDGHCTFVTPNPDLQVEDSPFQY